MIVVHIIEVVGSGKFAADATAIARYECSITSFIPSFALRRFATISARILVTIDRGSDRYIYTTGKGN
jgi:hypothetical protein